MHKNLFRRLCTISIAVTAAVVGVGALTTARAAAALPAASPQVVIENPCGPPPPPPPGGTPPVPVPCFVAAPLGYVQTASTGSGTVEVHYDGFGPPSYTYTRSFDTTSDFSPSDAPNGAFSLIDNVGGKTELGFVKTAKTASGTVEVHIDALNGSFVRVLDTTSDFSPSDASNGTFSLFGDVNGEPELGFVKTANTGSGMVEVFVDVWNGTSYARYLNAVSDFTPSDAASGVFDLVNTPAASDNGQPELVYIKERNTGSGTVEVHIDHFNGSGYVRQFDTTSDISDSLSADGTFEAYEAPDGMHFGFVQTAGVSVATLRLETINTAGTYGTELGTVTDFAASDAANGSFQLLSY
jgi:hypothetical protein